MNLMIFYTISLGLALVLLIIGMESDRKRKSKR